MSTLRFPKDVQDLSLKELDKQMGRNGLYFYELDSNSPTEMSDNRDRKFKIERQVSLYPQSLPIDATDALNMTEDEIQNAITLQKDQIDAMYKELRDRADALQKETATYLMWLHVLYLKRLRAVMSTHNQWQPDNSMYPGDGMVRSNAVYKMYYRTDVSGRWEKGALIPNAWHVTWWIVLQNPTGSKSRSIRIAGQDRKLFKSESEAQKYLEGRISAYDKLFQEEYPRVPPKYAEHFSYMGQLLPGYHL